MEKDINLLKENINKNYLDCYEKMFSLLNFILDEYSRELTRSDIEFLDMPKGAISTLDFLVSAALKLQKGHRITLGMDLPNDEGRSLPQINIIEGLSEDKI